MSEPSIKKRNSTKMLVDKSETKKISILGGNPRQLTKLDLAAVKAHQDQKNSTERSNPDFQYLKNSQTRLKELKVQDSVGNSKTTTIDRYNIDSLDENSEYSQGDMDNNMKSTFDVHEKEKGDI